LRSTFIVDDGPLHNPVHAHLLHASIGVLWTSAENGRHGKTIVGQAEHDPPNVMGRWARARAQQQLEQWFGTAALDFLITLYAPYAAECSDAEFCALIEHELGHCGQARDIFGVPKFSRTGLPVYAMRGHDIEQFTFVVARYGANAAGVRAMIEAAKDAPQVDDASLQIACGSCT
jgi:hypothetical protein